MQFRFNLTYQVRIMINMFNCIPEIFSFYKIEFDKSKMGF